MRTVLALAALALLAAPARTAAQEADGAWRPLEVWMDAIEQHTPGGDDRAVRAMLALRTPELESAFPYMVHALGNALADEERKLVFEAPFREYAAREHAPRDRLRLDTAVKRVVAFGKDRFLKRAAVLHADITLIAPAAHLTLSAGTGQLVDDGRGRGDEGRPWHWMLGRAFLRLLQAPDKDAHARIWYQAVATYLWSTRNFTELMPHLRHAVDLFPRDAEISFVEGLAHESQAAPHIQAALEGTTVSFRGARGVTLQRSSSVGSAAAELDSAREAFARAIASDPSHLEARIRHARLLTLDGQQERAARELTDALGKVESRELRYFASLFLGRAEESRQQWEAARAAYEAAAALYPDAQSPRLSLSQLALRSGDRDTARAVFDVLSEPLRDDADPWWRYHHERASRSRPWLQRMWIAFLEVVR